MSKSKEDWRIVLHRGLVHLPYISDLNVVDGGVTFNSYQSGFDATEKDGQIILLKDGSRLKSVPVERPESLTALFN